MSDNRYTYGIHQNLTAADLFAYVALDETRKQLGFDDLAAASAVFVNVVVASLHAHCFNSARGARSGLSQTSFFNSQLRVERDQRCGLLALACA